MNRRDPETDKNTGAFFPQNEVQIHREQERREASHKKWKFEAEIRWEVFEQIFQERTLFL